MLEVTVLTHHRYVANVNYFEMSPDVRGICVNTSEIFC